MVKALIDANINLAIYGSGRWKEYDFAKDYYYGFIPTEKFDEVLSKGKIVLAFLEDHIDGKLHMNTKIWEAVRVARLPIATDYKPLNEDYDLKEDDNIVTYSNIDELVQKVKHYSEDNSKRLRIAQNLYKKVEEKFDYSLMYKELFINLIKLQTSQKNIDYKDSDIYTFLNKNTNIKHFKSGTSELDIEVINHLKIINKIDFKQVDYIYYDRLENGKRVISFWPFISWDNIVFLNKQKNVLFYFIIFFKSFILGKTVHIKQFCVVSEKHTFFGNINGLIEGFLDKPVGMLIKKYFKRIIK